MTRPNPAEDNTSELLGSGRATFTRAETARILGIDSRTVSAAIDRGEIAAAQFGARVLVLAAPLLQQLAIPDSSEAGPPRPAHALTSPDETGANHENTRTSCHCRCVHDLERQEPRRLG